MGRRYVGRKDARELASQRVDKLFALAEAEARTGNDGRAKKYVVLALRMSQRHKVPAGHKRKYCPSCHAYLVPARNARVRTNKGMVTMTCLGCGKITRYPMERRMRR